MEWTCRCVTTRASQLVQVAQRSHNKATKVGPQDHARDNASAVSSGLYMGISCTVVVVTSVRGLVVLQMQCLIWLPVLRL